LLLQRILFSCPEGVLLQKKNDSYLKILSIQMVITSIETQRFIEYGNKFFYFVLEKTVAKTYLLYEAIEEIAH
jgi:hypothetical protein